MSKGIIWALIGIGLVLVVGGLAWKVLFWIGIAAIAAGLYLGIGPDGILRKEQVTDNQWASLLEQAHGKAEELFNRTEERLRELNAPGIVTERRAVAPGILKSLTGVTRDFLIVRTVDNGKLSPYRMFINARDFGNQLDVSWYLTYKPTLLQSLAFLLPAAGIVTSAARDLDLFDQQDLRAYVSTGHQSLLDAVKQLMDGMGQDFTKIETKANGFLGIA